MKNAGRAVLSMLLGLMACLLTGASVLTLHASGGTSCEQRISRPELLAENQQAAASGINSGANACLPMSFALVLMMTKYGPRPHPAWRTRLQ